MRGVSEGIERESASLYCRFVEEPRKGLFGQAKFSTVDLNTSSLKMYWNVARQFGGQVRQQGQGPVLSGHVQAPGLARVGEGFH